MTSLRRRLLAGTVAIAAAVLASSSLLAWLLTRAAIDHESDAALATQVRALTTLVSRDQRRLRIEYDAYLMPEYSRDERPELFCFWDATGAELLRSPALAAHRLPPPRDAGARPALSSCTLPDGRPGRIAVLAFAPDRAEEEGAPQRPRRLLTVAALRDTLDRDHRLAGLALILAAATAAGTAVAVAAMALLARHLLRPVDALAGRIAALDAERLAERIGPAGVPAELLPVVARLDDLLGRLDASFSRERSFTADAAHELRTPIAGLRTTLEVGASRLRPAEEHRATLGDCLEITLQMQALVDNLLSLARLEAGLVAVDLQPTVVAEAVAEAWKPFAARAAARRLAVTTDLDAVGSAPLDRAKLRLVLANLFDNAVSYADEGGTVAITARRVDGALALSVANSGCTLPPAAALQVFARFWRGDSARSAAGVHCGLGLALCRKLAVALGGTIAATIATGRFTVELRLPAG
jgi:signal transduction histidine kinase